MEQKASKIINEIEATQSVSGASGESKDLVPLLAEQTASTRPVHQSKLKVRSKDADDIQDEFVFNQIEEQRGYFEKTDRNEYHGEDLDVPTYLRRGIKIKLRM
jgi:cell division protein FtsZ